MSSTSVDFPAPLTPVTAVTLRRDLDAQAAAQVQPGEAPVEGGRGALVHQAAAVAARALPEIHHPVGGPDRLLVVLHHDDGVAAVADGPERLEELAVVALVQAHRRLVEDVEDALHPGADLAGEPDAVGLARGERGRRPVQAQVAHAHRFEEAQPAQDLLQQPVGDRPLALRELQGLEGGAGLADGKLHVVRQRAAADAHRQALPAQAGPAALRADRLAQVGPQVLERFAPFTLVGDFLALSRAHPQEPLEPPAQIGKRAREPVAVAGKEDVARLLRQLPDRNLEREVVALGDVLERLPQEAGAVALPGVDGAFQHRTALVGYHLARVHLPAVAETLAAGAGAVGAVEGEGPGRHLSHRDVALHARETPAVEALSSSLEGDEDGVAGESERLLQPGHQPLEDAGPDHHPVHQHVDAVIAARLERDGLGQVPYLLVDAGAHETLAGQRGQLFLERPLAAADDRGEQGEHGALGIPREALRDLLRALGRDGSAATGAMRLAEGGEEDPEVVVDLRHRAHRGAGMGGRRALLDGDGRAEPGHRLHVRLLHLLQELPGIGGEALDVAALALGVQGVEGEAALAGARRTGDDHQAVAGQVAVHALQVVDPGPPDRDGLFPVGSHGAWTKTAFYQSRRHRV